MYLVCYDPNDLESVPFKESKDKDLYFEELPFYGVEGKLPLRDFLNLRIKHPELLMREVLSFTSLLPELPSLECYRSKGPILLGKERSVIDLDTLGWLIENKNLIQTSYFLFYDYRLGLPVSYQEAYEEIIFRCKLCKSNELDLANYLLTKI